MTVMPERRWCRLPTLSELEAFADWVLTAGVSAGTRRLMLGRARLRPRHRLAVNLKTALALTAVREIRNSIPDLLDAGELAALVELEAAPEWLRDTAQSLLDLHDRWDLVKAVSRKFRAAAAAEEDRLPEPKPLDHILGGSPDKEDKS